MGYLKDHMIQEMKLLGYSDATIRMYTGSVGELARFCGKSPLDISQAEVRDFFVHLAERGASATKRRISRCAIKSFYKIHGRGDYIDFIPRPRRTFRLPEVLDESEVETILNLCRTLRYKLLFTLIYSSGLRISEALDLRISDIDAARRTIHVRMAKGGKDRYTVLSSKALVLLKFYLNRYRPESLLFFSRDDRARKMQKRHCQQVFHELVLESRIGKRAHIHTLRHSFATHLLEHDTNIFYIMKLLGHASVSTTLVYLHLQRLDGLNIRSPLDLADISLEGYAESRSGGRSKGGQQPELCSA